TSSTTTSPTSGYPSALQGTSWNLATFRAQNAMKPASTSAAASLTFAAAGQLNGSTGCNNFSGTYTTSGSALTIKLGPMTKVGCPPDLDEQESAITTNLPKVTGYTISAGVLTLTGANAVALFTYRAASTGLTGTRWKVTGVNNGNGAVTTTTLTEKLTALF